MSLTLTPERRDALNAQLDRVIEHAQAARNADLLSDAKRALNEVWFAVYDVREAIDEIDRATREDAEAALAAQLSTRLAAIEGI